MPTLLKDGPRASEDLARATGTHAPSLYRLLRALANDLRDLCIADPLGQVDAFDFFALNRHHADFRLDCPRGTIT